MRRLFAWFKRFGRASGSPTRRPMPAANWNEPAGTPDIVVPTQSYAEPQQQYVPQDSGWQQASCDTSFTNSTSNIDSSPPTSCDSSSYMNP